MTKIVLLVCALVILGLLIAGVDACPGTRDECLAMEEE